MSSRSKAVISGLAVVAAYVAGAVLSGHMSPFARGPLLDGLGPPPPYRWVNPPPALRPTNRPPESGSYTLDLSGPSQPGVFETNDRQALVILPQGAIPHAAGASTVALTLTPLDPSRFGAPPHGFEVAGNVYRIEATYQPGGAPVGHLVGKGSQVALVYPLITTSTFTLQSDDGKGWTTPPSMDSHANHQVLATDLTKLGYFAVAVPATSPSPSTSPAPTTSGSPVPPLPAPSGGSGGAVIGFIALLAAVALLLFLRGQFVRRRNAREESSWGRGPRHRL